MNLQQNTFFISVEENHTIMSKTLIKVIMPSKRFESVLKSLKKAAGFVGMNVLEDDFHYTFMTYLLIGFIIGFFSCTGYTMFVGFSTNNYWTVLLQSFAYIGTAYQGVAKLINALANGSKYRDLIRKICNMYETYERLDHVYLTQLTDTLQFQKKVSISLSLICALSILGMVGVPIILSYIINEKLLILQFTIPGIDSESFYGYIAHQIIQTICVLFGIIGNAASDIFFLILVVHIPLMKNILKCKLNDLDKVLQEYPIDTKKTKLLLKDLCKWHQHYIDYSGATKNCFFWVIFVQIATAFNSIICTILCQFLGIMPTAPFYLVYSFVIMYTFAAVGNLVELSNEDVTTSIYDSLWYLLTPPEQKMILLMLRESQQTEGMSIGGISPLSLNAALQITKTIYSVTMMFNQFFKE